MNLTGRLAPVVLAVAFGLISVPLVAFGLVQPLPEWQQDSVEAPTIEFGSALLLAFFSAVTAAVVGGVVGGTLVRLRPVAAVLVALGTAWPIGIGMLSITAAIFQIPIKLGVYCIDQCDETITNGEPWSGFEAYPQSLWGGAVFVLPVVIALVLLGIVVWLSKRGRAVAPMIVMVGAYGSLHAMSVFDGNGIPFASLALGTLVWAIKLRQPATAPIELQAAPA